MRRIGLAARSGRTVSRSAEGAPGGELQFRDGRGHPTIDLGSRAIRLPSAIISPSLTPTSCRPLQHLRPPKVSPSASSPYPSTHRQSGKAESQPILHWQWSIVSPAALQQAGTQANLMHPREVLPLGHLGRRNGERDAKSTDETGRANGGPVVRVVDRSWGGERILIGRNGR